MLTQDDNICIGCKYCIQACPYAAMYADPSNHIAQKCDFCLHRIEQGMLPACVNTCNARARIFGDLNDPDSAVAKAAACNPVQTLRPGMGTDPRVFYIGLDQPAQDRIRKQRTLSGT